MAYIVNKTDGSVVATVADGQVDNLSTDLVLIGKNYSGFGEFLNENFIKLLENFSSSSEPPNPIKGQIWFDANENKLKVYSGTQFQPVSSATISSTQPANLGVGDLWFNDVDRQLYFCFDSSGSVLLLGPAYSFTQGKSGLEVIDILDNQNQQRVITKFWNNGLLLGLFSSAAFQIKLPMIGFGPAGKAVIPGFNQGELLGLKFDVTATNSENLGNEPASVYLKRNTDNIINGQLTITSNNGLLVGDSQQAQIVVVDGNVQFQNDAENRNITIKVKRGAAVDDVIAVSTADQTLGLYANNPASSTIIGGNVTIGGDLTVNGDVTTVNTSILVVEDKNIVLANLGDSSSNNDAYANGGGLILKGASDHELVWSQAEAAWISTEHLVLESGKGYRVKDPFGVVREVLTWNSLGPSITSIPGVTSFGTQTTLTIGPELPPGSGNPPTPYLRLQNNRISTLISNQDLELEPNGSGNVVLIGSPRITGLQDPFSAQDAATKEYVDEIVETRSLVFSIDVSDAISNAGIAGWLTLVAPPAEFRNGTNARILCTSISNSTSPLNINTYLTTSTTEFITPDAPASLVPGGTAFGINNVAFTTATIPAPGISVFRVVKLYRLVAGAWTFIS